VNYQIISITPHYRFNLYMGVFTVILLIFTNYIFIELYGLVGVAIGSLVSMVLVNLARHIFLVSKYKLSPFSRNTIKIATLVIILFFVSEWMPNVENLYWNAFIKTGVLALLYLPAAYLLKCSEDFNLVVNKYLSFFSRKSKK
jgi:O-antigen/teichoic acid export membrane protein